MTANSEPQIGQLAESASLIIKAPPAAARSMIGR